MNIVVSDRSLKSIFITCAILLMQARRGSTLPKIPLAVPIINFVSNLPSQPYSVTYSLIYSTLPKPGVIRNHEARDVFLVVEPLLNRRNEAQTLREFTKGKTVYYNPFSHIPRDKPPVLPKDDVYHEPAEDEVGIGGNPSKENKNQLKGDNNRMTADRVEPNKGASKRQSKDNRKVEQTSQYRTDWSRSWTILISILLLAGTYHIICNTVNNPYRFFPVSQSSRTQITSNRLEFEEE